MPSWSEVTITPTEEALASLRESWSWLLGEDWQPLLFSAIGDVFLRLPAGTVWWLSTATGSLEQVAASPAEFAEMLQGERADEWFLPGLVDALRDLGKPLSAGQCYWFVTLPVFAEGGFCAENMFALDAAEHYRVTGQVMRQIRSLPDGAKVSVKFDM